MVVLVLVGKLEALMTSQTAKRRSQEWNAVFIHCLFVLDKIPSLAKVSSDIQNGTTELYAQEIVSVFTEGLVSFHRSKLTIHKDISCQGIRGVTVLSMRCIDQFLTRTTCKAPSLVYVLLKQFTFFEIAHSSIAVILACKRKNNEHLDSFHFVELHTREDFIASLGSLVVCESVVVCIPTTKHR